VKRKILFPYRLEFGFVLTDVSEDQKDSIIPLVPSLVLSVVLLIITGFAYLKKIKAENYEVITEITSGFANMMNSR
jgi:hypothetical protein